MRSIALLAGLELASCAPAKPDISVRDAWARATAPGQTSGALFATIDNAGGNDRLVGVHTAVAMAMLHRNDDADGIARMRMLSDVPILPRGAVTLSPGGLHVMLTGLKTPLVAGTHFPATLRFATSGERTVAVAVVAAGAR